MTETPDRVCAFCGESACSETCERVALWGCRVSAPAKERLDAHHAEGRYRCIVADPPWDVRQPPKKFGASGNAPLPYPTMTLDAIAALPVADFAAERAHLYLWVVNRYVADAYDIARAWDFKPSMLLTWCKEPVGQGPGYEFASTTEFVLFARRGKADYPPPARVDRNWWVWPRARHSQKPDALMDLAERLSPSPRLEMFARRQRLGWDTWGNEALNHVAVGGVA
jgi:N6-adenosine-specific RNA methylase IME4